MLWSLIALVLVGWGIAGIYDKKALRTSDTRSTFVAFQLFNVLMIVALPLTMWLVYGQWQLSAGVMFWQFLNAAGAMLALLCYYWVLKRCQASFVLGITAGYPIVGQFLAIPLLGEPLSLGTVIGAVVVSAGVAAIGMSHTPDEAEPATERPSSPLWLIVVCIIGNTVLWGVVGILDKLALSYARPLESYMAITIWRLAIIVAACMWFRRRGTTLLLSKPSTWRFAWASALLLAIGNLAYIFALDSGSSAGYLIVVTAAYPLVMCIVARFMLQERIGPLRLSGILLIVAGCVVTELLGTH